MYKINDKANFAIWALIILPFFSCLLIKRSVENQKVYFYLGSGFRNDTLRLSFNRQQFFVNAKSDFSLGFDVNKYFQCSENFIKVFTEGSVTDSSHINSCQNIELFISSGFVKLDTIINASNGNYLIVDLDKEYNIFRISQSDKSILLE